MKAPDKIFIDKDLIAFHVLQTKHDGDIEYTRKDIVDETIETAEDHAYFAGREKLRETLLKWAKEKLDDLTKKLKSQDDPVHWGQRNAFQQMIDKIGSMQYEKGNNFTGALGHQENIR